MDEPTSDVQATDITPDDFMADEQESTTVAPSAAKEEVKAPEKEPVAEKTEEAETDEATAPEAKETETEAPTGDETETDKPQGKAEERKSQLNTEIRDLVSQRNALRSEVEKTNAEVYQPATENELVDQGMSATDARVEALRQQIEMRDYNERVAEAQLTISSESERVLSDFPIFRKYELGTEKYDQQGNIIGGVENPEYDEELANEAAQTLQANLLVDPNTNQLIGLNPGFSTYQFYKTLARASGISQTRGQIKGQQAMERQLANADAPTSAAPPKAKVDPLIELWMSDD